MKVSIIIPVYNVEPYIERCLLSALNQTYDNTEIILVDDCGQDNSMSVARQITENHPFGNKVRFLKHERNRGLSAARNTGINAATGEYVYFLDSDDEITPDCISDLGSCADNNEEMIVGDFKVIGENRNKFISLPQNKTCMSGNSIIFDSFVSFKWYEMAWNKMINRKFLLKNALYFEEGIVHEDILWSFRVSLELETLVLMPSITYNYYIRSNSISGHVKQHNIDSYIIILNEIRTLIKVKDINKKFHNYWITKKYSTISTLFACPNFTVKEKKQYFKAIKAIRYNACKFNPRSVICSLPFEFSYPLMTIKSMIRAR